MYGAVRRFAGIGANSSSHLEKWISGAGGLTSILGISKDILDTLYSLASGNAESGTLRLADIRIGRYYSNGEFGPQWQVRQVIGESRAGIAESSRAAMVTYRIVAGHKRRQ